MLLDTTSTLLFQINVWFDGLFLGEININLPVGKIKYFFVKAVISVPDIYKEYLIVSVFNS